MTTSDALAERFPIVFPAAKAKSLVILIYVTVGSVQAEFNSAKVDTFFTFVLYLSGCNT